MLRRSSIACFAMITASLAPAFANAEQLTTRDALLIGSTSPDADQQGIWGSLNLAPGPGSALGATIDLDSVYDRGDRPSGGVIGLGGPFGVILDYSADIPRIRGLAYAPDNSLRFEARGELNTDTDKIGGRVSVHFNF